MTRNNGNGYTPTASVEVLTERITNVSKRLDEQVIASQTAITVALATQEKAVNAAFLASEKALQSALSASEKAISKSEISQGEVNKIISGLQTDVISLRESRSLGVGHETAKTVDKEQSNVNMGLACSIGANVLMLLALAFKMLVH
jgi:hypothetical protein